ERLNSLDGQKGRYITASELKTVVFNVSQALNQSVPLEEQLRQLALSDQPTEQSQIDLHLQQLMARYALMKLGERE
ncbi:MAG: hypothetical protein LBN41_07380, partial [Enterobacteriaceae bacterium]|nr:hypothetical protein [Enterobacteriaceae bacterium]MDR0806546.1 hypothetical protein [Enterobacteriaceae bacterium]